jgi:hypothetical protein
MNAKQRSERTSNKEKKTLNNMRKCNKQRAREHYLMNEKVKQTKQKN